MADNKKNVSTNTWSKAANEQKVAKLKGKSIDKELLPKQEEKPAKQPKPVVAKTEAIKAAKVEKLAGLKVVAQPKPAKVKAEAVKPAKAEKVVEPKTKSIIKRDQKFINEIKEKELIKQKIKEEKAAKKQNKIDAKRIYQEQIEEEKARVFLEKQEAAKKLEAEAEAKRLEEEKVKGLADKERLAEAKRVAKLEEEAEAKRLKEEKAAKLLADKEARNKKNVVMEKQTNKKTKNEEIIIKEVKEIEIFDISTQSEAEREFIELEPKTNFDKGIKGLKQKNKYQKQLTSKYSKKILADGAIITTTNCKPSTEKHIIELKDVKKSYITGDLETPILKGIDVKLDKGDFIVILGPSGSGKTTFLNVISGLDKATEGDVFILGSNLSLLKDSHLTKFRRRNVGFIFQQYNLLTNLTSKENAEVGQNLANKNKQGMSIEDIFKTIGMKEQMNKYPHQMSGGQQQRVSIARALAKNPEILFADEPTGALDEEMGRKVLEILVKVNREQKTTVVVVTHNPNIAKIANTVIHIKNGLIDSLEKNKKPADPKTIEWS